ncbi:MAG: hypothetical protein ABJA35_11750 [Parafilimonas sp.]
MAKIVDFFISGVWKTKDGRVSMVFLHRNSNNELTDGLKVAIHNLNQLIKEGKKIMTMRWSYESAKWHRGALLEVVIIDDEEILRTVKNSSSLDKLENQIDLSLLPQIFVTSVKQ